MEHPKRLPDVLDGVEHYSQVMSRHGLFAFQQVPYLLNQSFILISGKRAGAVKVAHKI